MTACSFFVAQAAGVDFFAWLDAPLNALLAALGALPFEWAHRDFMRFALLALLLIAPACGMVGVHVVHFRMAFFSDAIAHSAFSGVAIGFLLTAAGFSWAEPRYTLLVLGLLIGTFITLVKRRTDLGTDTIIGVAFSAVIAAGIAVITYKPSFMRDFNLYLYGDILLLDRTDLRTPLLLAFIAAVFMIVSYNRLLLMGFNNDLARTRGVATRLYDYLFAYLVVLLVTASIRLTGLLLVTALLVVPAAAARNLARSAGSMFWLATLIALVSAAAGLIVSYYLKTATGAAVILVGTLIFILSLALRSARRR